MTLDISKHQFANPNFIIEEEIIGSSHSLLTFKPLENGYGHTIGNALRRVLLSSLPGTAITAVTFENIGHQFSTIEGVKEDLVEILLNLKLVRINSDREDQGIARIEIEGPAKVTAADLQCEAGFEVVNLEQHLFSITGNTKVQAELKLESGVGYRAGDVSLKDKGIGELLVDAIFSPVLTVSYKVESTRVGRKTDFDKLLLDVKTDGTLTPREALNHAAKILNKQFSQILEPAQAPEEKPVEEISPEEAEILRLTVEELDLPTRIANALRKGGYKTVKDLSHATRSEVEKVKNIGEKSALIVEEALEKKGAYFSN